MPLTPTQKKNARASISGYWASVNEFQHAAVTATIGVFCFVLAELDYGKGTT